ncbi:MAG: SpoIIE family protein phosphatase [Polyangia bacterium]
MRQAINTAGLIDAKPVPTVTIRWPSDAARGAESSRRIILCADGHRDALFRSQSVCPRHAEIVSRQGEFFVVASTEDEPILVNGRRVLGEAHLREHDVIRVGDSEVRFRLALADELEADESSSIVRRATPVLGTSVIPNRTISVTEFLLQSRAMRVLSNATASLLVHHPFPVLFDLILDLVFESVPADFAAMILLDKESHQPVLKAGRDRQGRSVEERISQSIVNRVIEGQVAVMAGDALDDVNLRQDPGLATEPIHRVICAPLWMSASQGEPVRILGVLYANARLDRAAFREADLEILTVLANTAAAKIETAQLLEAGMDQRRLQEGLRVAAEIQASLLPRYPAKVPGYDLAGRTQSSEAVGGDFYDLAYDGGFLHLALGDVAGKGVGAAMLMVELRSTVRANWQQGRLAEAATRINGHFHLNIPSDRYATFFLGRLSPESGHLTYVNAGHNRPLLIGANGQFETLGEGGTAFGTFADSSYQEAQVAMRPNDTLVVYSDGISDAWPEPEAADRELAHIVRQAGTGGANQIQDAIFEAADRRTPELPRDDRTLVVVRRLAA